MHHSNQGSQYTSEEFQRLLADQGIACSMSRRGDCWDNAAMESFFSTLKLERAHRRRYQTRDEARADLWLKERCYAHANFPTACWKITLFDHSVSGSARWQPPFFLPTGLYSYFDRAIHHWP